MNWGVRSGDSPSASSIRAAIEQALLARDEALPEQDAVAPIVLSAVGTADDWSGATEGLDQDDWILLDGSDGSAVAQLAAAAKPSAIITRYPRTAVAHLATHSHPVMSLDGLPTRRTRGSGVIVVTGPPPVDPELMAALSTMLHGFSVTLVGDHNDELMRTFAGEHVTTSCDSFASALDDDNNGLVVITEGAAVLPDVPLAFGCVVASDRAPLLCDASLIPTVRPRPTHPVDLSLFDLLADPTTREWIRTASSEVVVSRVIIESAPQVLHWAAGMLSSRRRARTVGLGAAVTHLTRELLDRETEWLIAASRESADRGQTL